MSPPRKPRGEKPATTIRLLRRYLAEATRQIADLKNALTERQAVIAGYDVQISECDEETARMRVANDRQGKVIRELTAELRQANHRAAFLEGYYAKSQEAATPREELAFLTRTSLGNARSIAAAEADGEGPRHQGGPKGLAGSARRAFRMQQALSESDREGRAPARGHLSPSAAEARPSYTGSAPETGFDPACFDLTPDELAALDQMRRNDERTYADNRGTEQPRTPYRGIDGPLL